MQGIAEKLKTADQESSLVRVEANLEELPIFSAAKRARREEIVYWSRQGRDPVTHRPIEQKLTIRPARGLGLPAERERDLYYLVIAPWLEEHGFGTDGRIGPIRYQDACAMLGWKRSGRSYQLLREAINTLVSVHLEFENAIIDGQTRKLLARGGGLFSEWVMYGEGAASDPEKRITRGVFTLRAAPWFEANWKANYLKPIDRAIYRRLSGLSKALYSYLDKRAWRRNGYVDQVAEDLNDLRDRFRLGVRATKDLLKEFRHAHEDLRAAWPLLQEVRLEKILPGRYRAVYVFSTQVSLPFAGEPTAAPERPLPMAEPEPLAGEGAGLAEELRRRGMNQARADQLARSHSAEHILHHLDVHDQELKHVTSGTITNPPGRLYKRIVENWEPFEGYRAPEDRQRTQRAKAEAIAKQKAAREAEKAEMARLASLTPEEKARERLERYVLLQSFQRPVTPEQRERKYQEFLAEYQLQEASKIS